jgi:hypothetical protein
VKITKSQLKELIKEELEEAMGSIYQDPEAETGPMVDVPPEGAFGGRQKEEVLQTWLDFIGLGEIGVTQEMLPDEVKEMDDVQKITDWTHDSYTKAWRSIPRELRYPRKGREREPHLLRNAVLDQLGLSHLVQN